MSEAAYKILDTESVLHCSPEEVAVLSNQALPPLERSLDMYPTMSSFIIVRAGE